jgi:hypothetical protein
MVDVSHVTQHIVGQTVSFKSTCFCLDLITLTIVLNFSGFLISWFRISHEVASWLFENCLSVATKPAGCLSLAGYEIKVSIPVVGMDRFKDILLECIQYDCNFSLVE